MACDTVLLLSIVPMIVLLNYVYYHETEKPPPVLEKENLQLLLSRNMFETVENTTYMNMARFPGNHSLAVLAIEREVQDLMEKLGYKLQIIFTCSDPSKIDFSRLKIKTLVKTHKKFEETLPLVYGLFMSSDFNFMVKALKIRSSGEKLIDFKYDASCRVHLKRKVYFAISDMDVESTDESKKVNQAGVKAMENFICLWNKDRVARMPPMEGDMLAFAEVFCRDKMNHDGSEYTLSFS